MTARSRAGYAPYVPKLRGELASWLVFGHTHTVVRSTYPGFRPTTRPPCVTLRAPPTSSSALCQQQAAEDANTVFHVVCPVGSHHGPPLHSITVIIGRGHRHRRRCHRRCHHHHHYHHNLPSPATLSCAVCCNWYHNVPNHPTGMTVRKVTAFTQPAASNARVQSGL